MYSLDVYSLKWSPSEKKLARQVFEHALDAELSEILTEFKSRAQAASCAEDMWAVGVFLAKKQREIEEKYDYRYSQLILVFSRLIREGRVQQEQLVGLSEEKLSVIRRVLSI